MSFQEIELKLLADEQDVDDLRDRALALAGADQGTTRELRSVYFDTDGFALRKAGLALRLRWDGERWIQTVKARTRANGALSQAIELEAHLPAEALDLELIEDEAIRAQLKAVSDSGALHPVVETAIRRVTVPLATAEGSAEIAFDAGEIRAGGRSARLTEVEIELVEGRPDVIFSAAAQIFADRPVRFSRLSKSERGYVLATRGTIDPPAKARPPRIVELDADMPASRAVRLLMRECFEEIAANVEVAATTKDPEGPHQLRVGLRRLRSLLDAVGRRPELAALAADARWLGQQVGGLRNLDVLLDLVRGESKAHPDERALKVLAGKLATQEAGQRKALAEVLASARTQSFKLTLARHSETFSAAVPAVESEPQVEPTVRAFADAALDRAWRAVRKRGRRFRELDIEQRHELRKALKKLRYSIEFFRPLYGRKGTEAFLGRLERLQDIFGELNDVAMARQLLAETGLVASRRQTIQRGVGWIIGASQARADIKWKDARRCWRGLRRAGPFWG